MENHQIADFFSLLAKLLDIHGENSFKSKSYASAAFAIEKIPTPLRTLSNEQIASSKGIGFSSAQKIQEILETGKLKALDQIISETPQGIIEMLRIKGIGPKKINTIWKEMEIETIGELEYACIENRLKRFKGFGEKTQQNVLDSIAFYNQSKGRHLYAEVKHMMPIFIDYLEQIFGAFSIQIAGQYIRQLEIIDRIEFLLIGDTTNFKDIVSQASAAFPMQMVSDCQCIAKTPLNIEIMLHCVTENEAIGSSIQYNSSEAFWQKIESIPSNSVSNNYSSEEEFFESRGLRYIPPFLREDEFNLEAFSKSTSGEIIETKHIKGIIHSHSTWSDGTHSIEEMAEAAIKAGFEYLVISDHSQSAFYAQGLTIDRVLEQHKLINLLNEKYKPFKIFKSIESDILNDGSLDYPEEILQQFDLVIASVHSNLKMTEEKAMMRLLNAVSNPYTTILGHPTGRLLLGRPGYPVNMDTLTDACAKSNVVIELNAHPSRLDIDWRYINLAKNKNVMISIDPDAHTIEGFNDIEYGVLVAQKANVLKHENLSSFGLDEMMAFIEIQKEKRK
jgi:DNA polymerase (family 10)